MHAQVVIGETATIGHHCYILHGVTLGATGKAGTFDRHPKVPIRLSRHSAPEKMRKKTGGASLTMQEQEHGD
jgi:serine O-acetyltransferase